MGEGADSAATEFTLRGDTTVARGLTAIAFTLGIFVAVWFLMRILGSEQPPARHFIAFIALAASMHAVWLVAAIRAEERVLVEDGAIVRHRQALFRRTSRFDRSRVSSIRWEPASRLSRRWFETLVGAAGSVVFDYGEAMTGRLAIARTDADGLVAAERIDALLGNPEPVDDFWDESDPDSQLVEPAD